jgi:hypothetical protein
MTDDAQDIYVQGTPPALLMPAKNYVFKISKDNYIIELPRKGSYHELDPEFFTEEAGEFNLFDEESKIIFLPALTKVLFATRKYPELEFNQFFVPFSLKFEEDKVLVVGQVIEMMLVKQNEDTSEAADNKADQEGE